MKILYQGALLAAALALYTVAPRDTAHGQTQCPQGVTPGSSLCGPDSYGQEAPAGPPMVREKLDGFGGFAYNLNTGQVYRSSQPGTSLRRSAERALISCRQPLHDPEWSMTVSPHADAPCEVIFAWQNGCAAVTEGMVSGQRRHYAIKTRSKSSARKQSLQACEQSGAAQCTVTHDAVCTKPVTRLRQY